MPPPLLCFHSRRSRGRLLHKPGLWSHLIQVGRLVTAGVIVALAMLHLDRMDLFVATALLDSVSFFSYLSQRHWNQQLLCMKRAESDQQTHLVPLLPGSGSTSGTEAWFPIPVVSEGGREDPTSTAGAGAGAGAMFWSWSWYIRYR